MAAHLIIIDGATPSAGKFAYSLNGGSTWTISADTGYWQTGIALAPDGHLMSIQANSRTIHTSVNGTSWTAAVNRLPGVSIAIAWGSNKFIVIGNGVADVYTSIDSGANWVTRSNVLPTGYWTQVAWNGTKFCAVSSGYSCTSTDGITWSAKSTMPCTAPDRVLWSGSNWICTDQGTTGLVATSSDGLNWSSRATPTTGWTHRGVATDGAGTVIITGGQTDTHCSYSTNHGVTWNTGTVMPVATDWRAVAWDGTGFVAAAYGSANVRRNNSIAAGGAWTAGTLSSLSSNYMLKYNDPPIANATGTSLAGFVGARGRADYRIDGYLNLLFCGTALGNLFKNAASSPLTSLYVSLHTADPLDSGVQSSFEVTGAQWGGAYARAAVVRSPSGWRAQEGIVHPINDIPFPILGDGTGCTITHWAVGTASSGAGALLYVGTFASPVVISTLTSGAVFSIKNDSTITELP